MTVPSPQTNQPADALGPAVRAARRLRGLSVPAAARQIGIHPQTLRALENGRREHNGVTWSAAVTWLTRTHCPTCGRPS